MAKRKAALERKYPNANREWGWQYVFPSEKLSVDPRSGRRQRHHLSEVILTRAIKEALRKGGIAKNGSAHTLRHSFATLCWRPGTIFVPSRNSLGIRTLYPQWFIRIF